MPKALPPHQQGDAIGISSVLHY